MYASPTYDHQKTRQTSSQKNCLYQETRVDGNGTRPRDPSGGRRADAGTTVRTVLVRQREQVSVFGAQWHERAVGGASLGGTIGYVGGAALGSTIGWVTGGGDGNARGREARGGCIVERLRGEERNTPPRPLLYRPRSCAHTAQSSHSPGLAPGPNLSTLLAAHRTTQAPRGSTE